MSHTLSNSGIKSRALAHYDLRRRLVITVLNEVIYNFVLADYVTALISVLYSSSETASHHSVLPSSPSISTAR